MAMNGSEIRDTARVLGISINTVLSELKKQLDNFNIDFYYTDNWSSYGKYLPRDKHLISKKYTQAT